MAKPQIDYEITGGHIDGDEDGLGCPRGIASFFLIEILAAVAYGLVLHFGIWR